MDLFGPYTQEMKPTVNGFGRWLRQWLCGTSWCTAAWQLGVLCSPMEFSEKLTREGVPPPKPQFRERERG